MTDTLKLFAVINACIITVFALFYGLAILAKEWDLSAWWSAIILVPYAAWLEWECRRKL
jgi:hypothetical protein